MIQYCTDHNSTNVAHRIYPFTVLVTFSHFNEFECFWQYYSLKQDECHSLTEGCQLT